jgi:hypothetical protein
MSAPVIARFARAPVVGTAIEHDGQVFEVAKVEPYTRKDGCSSHLVTWRTRCLDCDAAVDLICGLPLVLKRRRCDEHKRQPFGSTKHPAEIG